MPCNTIGFTYNKGKIPEIIVDTKKVVKKYREIGIIVLKPIIDRLSFTVSPSKEFFSCYGATAEVEEFKKYVSGDLFNRASTGYEGLALISGVTFNKPPYRHYNLNLRLTVGEGASVFIQASPKSAKYAFLRFDYNPSRFNDQGLAKFRAFVEDIFEASGVHIPYDEVLAWADISRLDIAVDILGARPSDMEIMVMTKAGPIPQKSQSFASKTGRMETIYPKLKKDGSNREYVYDKRQELIDNGHEPLYGEFLHSRFECRIQKTKLNKLLKVHNRCDKVSIRVLDYKKFFKLHHTYKLFIRYALARRSVQKALDVVPSQLRPKYEKSYGGSNCISLGASLDLVALETNAQKSRANTR